METRSGRCDVVSAVRRRRSALPRIISPYAKGPILFFKRKAKEPELKPCPQCGAQIAASALDCPSCGLDLREAYHPAPEYARKTD